jgi:hypothetical protein
MPIGTKAHGGNPLSRRGATTTLFVGSTNGSTLMECPQLGQETALVDTSCPHSGQDVNDINNILRA